MRRFDASDELRATADRRKQPGDVAASQLRGESVQQMASRVALMFPGLPEDTVEAVLSELFRSDAKITRELLADRAIASLVEMSLADGSPQVITSFEPPSIFEPQLGIPIQPTAASSQALDTGSAFRHSAVGQEVPGNASQHTGHDVAADDVEMTNMGSLRPAPPSKAEGYQWEPIELQTPLAHVAADANMEDCLDDFLMRSWLCYWHCQMKHCLHVSRRWLQSLTASSMIQGMHASGGCALETKVLRPR